MKSNKKANPNETAAIYLRISREDKGSEESYIIQNQRKLLKSIAEKKGFEKCIEFSDDGISGTSRDRKSFNKMIAEIESGKASFSAVIVKDLSRLARDYIRAGIYIEEVFPEHDIRFISVGESIDSKDGTSDYAPYVNFTNEQYAKDISKKRKLTNLVKGEAGEPLSLPPYGYMKDPDNPKRWIVDDEAAAIVRRIFRMTLDGHGTEQIAKALTADKILTPTFYWISKGINRGGRKPDKDPCHWASSTVSKILGLQEYCGDVINFKTYSKSYKLKKRIANSEEDMAIFHDAHEPIVDRVIWENLQKKRESKTRKRKSNDGEKNMFSGLLKCADCGHNLWFHFNQKNHDIKYFNCSNYKGNRGTCDTTHYIRVDFLEEVLLQEIRRLTRFASRYEDEFAKLVMGHSVKASEFERDKAKKELYALNARDRELDRLFNRMYEDNVAGKIDDARFAKMSSQYTAEQVELLDKIKSLQSELDKESDKAMTADAFISTVRKYTRAKKLTEGMLNELIERIEVHQSAKIDGVQHQDLTIYYNCVGAIEIPELVALPEVEVTMKTRKGVAVSYSPSQNVVNF